MIQLNDSYTKNLINMIYKLLPLREEGDDWKSYLDSIIQELNGLFDFVDDEKQVTILRLISKLNNLRYLENEKDFLLYRKIVFESINLLN